MAETRTNRLGLPNWSQGNTDAPQRGDFNEAFSQLESNAAIFSQGTLAVRPTAGKVGRFYAVIGDSTPSNNGLMFYDTGSAWIPVGNTGSVGNRIKSSNAGSVALIIEGSASQSAHLMEWQDDQGNVLAYISASGAASFAGIAFGGNTEFTNLVVNGTALVQGATTLHDTTVQGTLRATNFVSTALRTDGTPKTSINGDGTGWLDALIPPGTILPTGRSTAPGGFLMCQGQSLNRSDYPDLFAAIGTAFGASDSSTFNAPDLRDRIPIGAGGALGNVGARGGSTHNHGHSHTINSDTVNVGSLTLSTQTTNITINSAGAHTHGTSVSNAGDHTHTASAASTGAHTHTIASAGLSNATNTAVGGSAIRIISGETHQHGGATGSDGYHGHTVSVTNAGSHTHTVSVLSDGAHNHTVNDNGHTHTVTTSGGATTHNHGGSTGNQPDYQHPYALVNYMIRT